MWFALYRRLFFRRVDPQTVPRAGLIESVGGKLFPRHCYACGNTTRAWEPFCSVHRGEIERPGDINP